MSDRRSGRFITATNEVILQRESISELLSEAPRTQSGTTSDSKYS